MATTHALNSETRGGILHAALKRFAHSGYAAASVQQIVDDAKVSKPALYYYFGDKAGLFQALVDEAHDERLRLMEAAVARGKDLKSQLVEIFTASFDYLEKNRELMRIAFATAFAAPGEMPDGLRYSEKCERNFEFIHSLMKKALAAGALDKRFDSRELAYGFYGQLNAYLVSQLLMPDCRLDRDTAERIVELFLAGAAAKKRGH
ncbi:MAG TPA: TetR/AcrR family transcriptional regulator [Verrucomicrobiae bacterium]|nr:TetR/AcrR family transcriptional regulator [Verrucomicrobiae bacterium]